jgi:chromosome segregation ATPase
MSETNKIIDIKAERAIENNQTEKIVNQGSETTKSFHKILPVKTENNNQENVDWFALARKLRHDNRQIVKNLVEREEELALVKEQLQAQITKIHGADILVKQQTEELNIAQEQISRLLQELENAQKIINQKQKDIEQFSAELIENQQQIAHLERQCSNLQDDYEKEKQKSSVLEQQLKESEFRLKREQRHNLQFKAALNQCLEKPDYVAPINIGTEEQKTPSIISPNSRIPKNEGIKPWSDYLEELEDLPEETPEHQEENSHFIPQLQILNDPISAPLNDQKKSPSPLLNKGNYQAKTKSKREISLPTFTRLHLNDQV